MDGAGGWWALATNKRPPTFFFLAVNSPLTLILLARNSSRRRATPPTTTTAALFSRGVRPPAPPPPPPPSPVIARPAVWALVALQTVALVGAAVTGTLARRRRLEAEGLVLKLRAVNVALRERAADADAPPVCAADEDRESAKAYAAGLAVARRSEDGGAEASSSSSGDEGDAAAGGGPPVRIDAADLSVGEARRHLSRCLGEAKQALRRGCARDAVALTVEAAGVAQELGDARAERAVVRLAARAKRAAGDVRGGLADLMRSVALSATIGDAAGDADVAGDIADSHAELGDFEAAARWYDTCLAAIAAEDGWASEGGGALASSWWDC